VAVSLGGGGACARAGSGCDAGLCWFDVGYARAAFAQMGVDCSKLPPAPATGAAAANAAGAAAAATAQADTAAGKCASAAEVQRAALDKAAALRPKDGAVHLGIALALYEGGDRDEQACMQHLDTALTLADDSASLLRANLLGTMGKFLGAHTHEDLVAAVRERTDC
jgi:hypothetical protein